VVRLVVGQGMRLALAGAAVGLAGALALGRVLRSLLYEVGPADPFTYSAVLVVAMAVAAVACYLPAYRATTVDPISALRSE
jgi:ABC-type antimicrobial peptide transport system permease subunit